MVGTWQLSEMAEVMDDEAWWPVVSDMNKSPNDAFWHFLGCWNGRGDGGG